MATHTHLDADTWVTYRPSVGARGAPFSFNTASNSDTSTEGQESSDIETNVSPVKSVDASDEAVKYVENLMGNATVSITSFIVHQALDPRQDLDYRKGIPSKIPTAKRVLSSNTLAALNAAAGRSADSPKKKRSSPDRSPYEVFPELSLGCAALDEIQPIDREYQMRDTPCMSSDEEELDKRLSEELDRYSRLESSRENSPVPLLTPPQSPLTVNIGENTATVCEWPSNLAVDISMMAAAADVRPLSPASLQKLDEEEQERFSKKSTFNDATTLTPLLQSIYVGTD